MPKRPVYTLIPHNGNRRTATLWCVGRLVGNGEFEPVTKPMSKEKAEEQERALRTKAKAEKP